MASWTGIPDAIAALTRLSERIDEATSAAAKDGSLIVQAKARTNAQFDPQMRTGRLIGSITSDGPTQTGDHSYRARTYPTVVYGRIQELGGPIVERRAGHQAVKDGIAWSPGQFMLRDFVYPGSYLSTVVIHPHPYLTPALESSHEAYRGAAYVRWAGAIGG